MFKDKKVLIPFIMGGFPSLDQSYEIAKAMIENGAGVLELGVPFSDPSADGATLQLAADLALKNNVTLVDILNLGKRIHRDYPQVPIVIFTYLNPLLAMGLENYVKLAAESGIFATLTVDLPLEESDEYQQLHEGHKLKTVFLASPTTGAERLVKIASASTGFLYYVSRAGVTGEQAGISSSLDQEIKTVRSITSTPLAIGFGISNPEQAKEVSLKADAVVIGSAYMRIVLETPNFAECLEKIRSFTHDCAEAIKVK